MNIINKFYEILKKIDFLSRETNNLIDDRDAYKVRKGDLEMAIEVMQAVANITQSKLKYKITNLVNYALNIIYPEQFEMILDFEMKRNKSEANIKIKNLLNGKVVEDFEDEESGGIMDICALALRITMWQINPQKTSPIMILDEPFHYTGKVHLKEFNLLLNKLSDKMGIQFIIITHEKELEGENVFEVTKDKYSSVNEI